MVTVLALSLTLGCTSLEEYAPKDTGPLGPPTTPTGPVDGDNDGYNSDVDCDDTDPAVHLGAEERCNDIDDDCDGDIDENAVDARIFFRDADEDGFGNDDQQTAACDPPPGWLAQGGDCDDSDPAVHPDADEYCNGFDDDCDLQIDESAVDAPPWYTDADGDSFGDAKTETVACEPAKGQVADDTDCDDTDPEIFPGAEERCNGIDDDCDGIVPLEEDDFDGDGWRVCDGDLDDTDPTVTVGCLSLSGTYSSSMSFRDAGALEQTRMTGAWDGTSLWASSGGSSTGIRLSEFDASGTWLGDYAPGYDVRSVFTMGDGTSPLYLRAYASASILVETSPGVFSTYVTLSGTSIDAQSAVVYDDTRNELIAQNLGRLDRFDATSGALVGTLYLSGYGSTGTESTYPQSRGVAVTKGCYLTYADGNLNAWDDTGTRVGTAFLSGAGTSFDSYFSFSYFQGRVWVLDYAGGNWQGYDIGF